MSSSLVPVTVEHPQYTQTFVVSVPPAGTVGDIKHEIERACPGNPRREGQRLISKGRVLDDTERIDALWVSEEDAHVVHLAVNPLSWSSKPPEIPAMVDSSPPELSPFHEALQQRIQGLRGELRETPSMPPPSLPRFQTFPFINYMHHKALRALSPSTPPAAPGATDSAAAKDHAKASLQAVSHPWPDIFDAEFPPSTNGGVTYEYTLISGKPFLQNMTLHATPTARQQHALNVLAYTFPLLTLVPPAQSHIVQDGRGPSPRVNIIQNLNAPPPRADGNARNVIAVRVNMRELLTPLILLFIRTLLLLYFFSPARKPVFGVILGAYILYEAWGAVRGAIFDVGPLNANGGAARADPRRRADANEPPIPNNAAGAMAPPNPGAAAAASFEAGLDHLAQMNVDTEARWLEEGTTEPGLFYKVSTFVVLFLLSIHPAFWNRRRTALRAREGRLRTEANAVERAAEQQAEGEEGVDERARQAREQVLERHARRPAWIREYIDRVRRGDWVDE